jgi:hypothetical protein
MKPESEECDDAPLENEPEQLVPEPAPPVRRWRPAEEPTFCGSGCIDCPF